MKEYVFDKSHDYSHWKIKSGLKIMDFTEDLFNESSILNQFLSKLLKYEITIKNYLSCMQLIYLKEHLEVHKIFKLLKQRK